MVVVGNLELSVYVVGVLQLLGSRLGLERGFLVDFAVVAAAAAVEK
jgi:hypothetical protein